jgi:curli biogenesis system outer membrane secretion channel CsgG
MKRYASSLSAFLIAMLVAGCAANAPSRPPARLALKLGIEGSAKRDLIQDCIARKAWLAFFKDDKGRILPVRDTQGTGNDADWLGLRFTDYDGPRIRLGVLKVINRSPEAEESESGGKIEVPVSGIQEMLTVALYGTRRFDVIEQRRIEEIQKQQTRKDLMAPSPGSIMKVGKALSAQYLVYGTVNEWIPDRARKGIRPLGPLGGLKQESEVAITFSLADVDNGQILFTTAERAKLGEWSLDFQQESAGTGTTRQTTPVSYAIRVCSNKAALKIAAFLRDRKWKGSVVKIEGPNVYVNAGSQQGMGPGLLLAVFRVKGVIKDLDNRMVLGEDLMGIGSLQVFAVQAGFSIGRAKESTTKYKKGDRVELATVSPPPPVPEGCKELDGSRWM